MITTGSVRGKCWVPQAGQERRQPASATVGGRAAVGAEAVRACQPRMPLAVAAVPASSAPSAAIIARRSPKARVSGQPRVRGAAVVEEGPRRVGGRRGRQSGIMRAKRGPPASMPRKIGGSGASAKTGLAIGSQPSRVGRRRYRAAACRARAAGSAPRDRRRAAPASASPRRCEPRSSRPPAKVTASASFIVVSARSAATMPEARRDGQSAGDADLKAA